MAAVPRSGRQWCFDGDRAAVRAYLQHFWSHWGHRPDAELTDEGGTGVLKPWDAFWGMRYAVVHDPDGNPVDLFAPLPS